MFDYITYFKSFPPELATFIIASLPIAELRASLPIALGVYKLPLWSAFLWSVIGNLLPTLIVLYFLEPISEYLIRRSKYAKTFFERLFAGTRKKFNKKYQRYGEYALIIFVAIPLPFTGAWTGSIAAFLFGIPRWRAIGLISIGVLLAGILVVLMYKGAFGAMSFIS